MAKKDKRTNNDLQNITQKTKDRVIIVYWYVNSYLLDNVERKDTHHRQY